VVLRYLPDVPVRVVAGSEHNLKITYPRDLAIAETLLQATDRGGVSS
jgi:2-C-methyl-D-erythritol 4-phosphate cytidylyltransferase